MLPRCLARWPSRSAMVAHDAQCAAAGVTTILDALCLGDLGFDAGAHPDVPRWCRRSGRADARRAAEVATLSASALRSPRARHAGLFDTVADHPLVRMISLMDHSPGVGPYANLEFYRTCGAAAAWMRPPSSAASPNCRSSAHGCASRTGSALLDRVRGRGIALASHDDRTVEEIAENAADGIRISEFPGHHGGSRGGEGSGHGRDRRSAEHRARRLAFGQHRRGRFAAAGWVDVFASDYVPPAWSRPRSAAPERHRLAAARWR